MLSTLLQGLETVSWRTARCSAHLIRAHSLSHMLLVIAPQKLFWLKFLLKRKERATSKFTLHQYYFIYKIDFFIQFHLFALSFALRCTVYYWFRTIISILSSLLNSLALASGKFKLLLFTPHLTPSIHGILFLPYSLNSFYLSVLDTNSSLFLLRLWNKHDRTFSNSSRINSRVKVVSIIFALIISLLFSDASLERYSYYFPKRLDSPLSVIVANRVSHSHLGFLFHITITLNFLLILLHSSSTKHNFWHDNVF